VDAAAGDLERDRVGCVADFRLAVEQREHADRGRQALLQVGVQPGQALDRLVGQEQRGDEGEERSGRLGAGNHRLAAVEDHRDDRQATEHFHDRVQHAARARALVIELEHRLDGAGGARLLVGLHGVGLDVAHALEGLVEQGGQAPDLGLGMARYHAHPAADADDRQDRGRKNHEGDRGQQPVLVEHHAHQRERGQRILAEADQGVGDGVAQQVDVVDEAGDQLARRSAVEERQIGPDHAGVEAALEFGDDAVADIAHQHRLAVGGQALGREDGEHRKRDRQQHLLAPADEDFVDDRLDQLGERRRAQRHHHHAEQRRDDSAGLGPQVVAHQAPDQRLSGLVEAGQPPGLLRLLGSACVVGRWIGQMGGRQAVFETPLRP
jgi:hypothetical protein